jgi:hypothetical protein
MKPAHLWSAAFIAALLGLPGCATLPAQDVDFVRGCWVTRAPPDGPVAAMLRLLPEGAEGPTYQGVIREFSGPPNDPQGRDTVDLIFSRDGRWLDLVNHAPATQRDASDRPKTGSKHFYASAPPDHTVIGVTDGMRWAAYSERGGSKRIIVLGGNGRLIVQIFSSAGKPGQTVLAADRDGYD